MQDSRRLRRWRGCWGGWGWLSALVIGALGAHASAQVLATKSVNAPADDILSGVVVRPDPMTLGVSGRSAVLPITLTLGAGGAWSASVALTLEDPATTRVMIVSPDADVWRSTLRLADGSAVELSDGAADARVTTRRGLLGIPGVSKEGTLHELSALGAGAAGAAGPARVEIVSRAAPGNAAEGVHGWLLVTSDHPATLYAAADAPARVGEPVMLYAAVYDRVATPHLVKEAPPLPLRVAAMDARAFLEGDAFGRAMEGEGLGLGEARLDVVFDSPGVHRVRVMAEAELANGARVMRTATVLVPVTGSRATIEGATAAMDGDAVAIGLKLSGAALPERMLVAAEVWGMTAEGPAPVCWAASMIAPVERFGETTVRIDMHADWPSAAKVGPPFVLRNVRLEDADHHVVFAESAEIAVEMPAGLMQRAVRSVTPAMLTGVMDAARGVPVVSAGEAAQEAGVTLDFSAHNLMMIHGYCAGGVPWPLAQFSPPLSVFGDFNQSRSNDEFAQLIGLLGTLSKSFGVVAHSQGGLASLHLYTFYWSGLDWARGPRLIQSVGSPYQGTPLAGDLAVLGSIFGAGCGENFDLTDAGAAAWLSSIPSWARQRVYYHTTSFADPPGGFDYCNLLSGFFLSDPEDGVVEMSAGQLPGANNMGHKEGWCHTTGMQDPAQYLDSARNADMNANAAR